MFQITWAFWKEMVFVDGHIFVFFLQEFSILIRVSIQIFQSIREIFWGFIIRHIDKDLSRAKVGANPK